MVLGGRSLAGEPLSVRRELLETKVLPKLVEPVRYVGLLDAPLSTLIQSVKADGLEGLVAKRLDSRYEPGLRSGAWLKMRVNRGQEFVIGGYTVGANPIRRPDFEYYAATITCGTRSSLPCAMTKTREPSRVRGSGALGSSGRSLLRWSPNISA